MPINRNLVPTIQPGALFNTLIDGDYNLSIRYHVIGEPVYFTVFNRPLIDIEMRQLVVAKSVDTLQLAYGSVYYYPFLNQPYIDTDNGPVAIPKALLWDLSFAMPEGWENLRLHSIKRISGENTSTGQDIYTGQLRLLFSASPSGDTDEYVIKSFDYALDSDLSYQIVEGTTTDMTLSTEDSGKFFGFATLSTPDLTSQEWVDFLDALAPPTNATTDSGGLYTVPTIYEILDSEAGTSTATGDFSNSDMSHGTGLLSVAAVNFIPRQITSADTILASLNFPFYTTATRTNSDGIELPVNLFREFDITAPAGDGGTTAYPVWISKLSKISDDHLKLTLSTYPVVDGSSSAVEFAYVLLDSSMVTGAVVEFIPFNNLYGISDDNFAQDFGVGHVVLGEVWSSLDGQIALLFTKTNLLTDSSTFTLAQTRLCQAAISRFSKLSPTVGQHNALYGSSARRSTPIYPSDTNRYITEADTGLGDQLDFLSVVGVTEHAAIERYGNIGSSSHRTFSLCVDRNLAESVSDFYTTHILPRMVALLGREPIWGDEWYDGVSFLKFNGDFWIK